MYTHTYTSLSLYIYIYIYKLFLKCVIAIGYQLDHTHPGYLTMVTPVSVKTTRFGRALALGPSVKHISSIPLRTRCFCMWNFWCYTISFAT